VPEALSTGVKHPDREADHSRPSSIEVRIHGSIPPLFHTSSWHRDVFFTFAFANRRQAVTGGRVETERIRSVPTWVFGFPASAESNLVHISEDVRDAACFIKIRDVVFDKLLKTNLKR